MTDKTEDLANEDFEQDDITPKTGTVISMAVGDLMRKNYLNYAVSVIMERALPDVRDGLKPVHRRILYAMHGLGMRPNGAYKKSARMVGDAMGKYHPHGDSAIYDAAVYMAQPWSKSVTLIDGQGNFGSIDGDPPAAMRYTEMRFTEAGFAFFDNIDKNTVNFHPNYDGSETEPEVLPVSYPNIWVNGVEGIAVGMASYLPPHNLNETIDVTLELQKNPDLTIDEILKIMPAPDFPTGGVVHDLDGYREALETGKGLVKVRSKWHSETIEGQETIVIDELPFKVNKKELIEYISILASTKASPGRVNEFDEIVDIRDESEDDVRIVIFLKKGAIPEVIFNHLVKRTSIEKSYNYNVMLLQGQAPKQMDLISILKTFLSFRTEVIERKTQFELDKAKGELYTLEGFMKVLSNVQEAVQIIMDNTDSKTANVALMQRFDIEEAQAKSVLELRLQRLTGMEIDSIKIRHKTVTDTVADLMDILAKPERVQAIIRDNLLEAKQRFGTERRSEISYENNEINMFNLVKKEPCLIHVTKNGYLKRMPLSTMEAQKRNGKGRMGIQTNDGDYVQSIYTGSTHDLFIAFTESGKALSSRVWKLPDGQTSGRGRHLKNIFESLDEPVTNLLFVPEIESGLSVITVTANGKVKRTALEEYTGTARKKGIQGLSIEENDKLVSVLLAKQYDHLILVTTNGKAARFEIEDSVLATRGRKSLGVMGIRVAPNAKVIGAMVIESNGQPLPYEEVEKTRMVDGVETKFMDKEYDTGIMDSDKYLFCVGENGVGKRTAVSEFTPHSRGTKGVTCFNINDKTGGIVKTALVTEDEDLMMTTANKTIRIHVSDIRLAGRNTAGTMLMNVSQEKIIDVVLVPKEEEAIEDEELNEDIISEEATDVLELSSTQDAVLNNHENQE